MKSATFLILLGIVSIIVSACSSSDPEPTATVVPTATDVPTAPVVPQVRTFYLESIENNAVQVTAAFARIGEQMSKTWPTKGALLDAFNDSNVSQEIISSMSAIVQLFPPDEFEEEHRILQSTANTVVEYAHDLERALQGRDLVGMMVAKANFAVSYKRMLLSVSPRLCSALGIDDDPEVLCEINAGTPGTYDAEVERLFKVFRVEFIPRVTSFALALSEEERFSVLAALNREVEVATGEAAEKLAALSPPEGRADDHKILLTFLEDTGETALAISIAGTDRDDEEIERLFTQSGTVAESAESSISCEYSETLLHRFFRSCVS